LIIFRFVSRRRSSAEEIDSTINNLTNDRQALAAATQKAEKMVIEKVTAAITATKK
jgi:hypothetical protein